MMTVDCACDRDMMCSRRVVVACGHLTQWAVGSHWEWGLWACISHTPLLQNVTDGIVTEFIFFFTVGRVTDRKYLDKIWIPERLGLVRYHSNRTRRSASVVSGDDGAADITRPEQRARG